MKAYDVLRPLLFRLDAERAHELAFTFLRGLEATICRLPATPRPWSHPQLVQTIWGHSFPNPIGLAAGFDKNARTPHVWPLLGFGFAEIGTVTAHAQPGNPRPRMFRLPADQALINRLGFNNDGATAVAARLKQQLSQRPLRTPLGINLGKSRIANLDQAVDDYLLSFRALFPYGDYFVVNVSSPNTPGLRDLQQEEHLAALMAALAQENERLAAAAQRPAAPLLIKVAPDLDDDGLRSIVEVAIRNRAAGLVATNTTISRAGLHAAIDEAGGLSGQPLRARSTAVIRLLRRSAGAALPIIGVGGVFTAQDAYEKIRAGASLVQMYTGFIYGGPTVPRHLARGLLELLQRDGFAHVSDAIGCDVRSS